MNNKNKQPAKATEENYFLAELKQRKEELNAELKRLDDATEGQLHQVSCMLQYATIQIQEILNQDLTYSLGIRISRELMEDDKYINKTT